MCGMRVLTDSFRYGEARNLSVLCIKGGRKRRPTDFLSSESVSFDLGDVSGPDWVADFFPFIYRVAGGEF